jgi:hypothetical protein
VTEDKWLALKMANYYMSDLNWDLSLSNSMFILLVLCPKPKTLLSFVLKAPSSLSFRRKKRSKTQLEMEHFRGQATTVSGLPTSSPVQNHRRASLF